MSFEVIRSENQIDDLKEIILSNYSIEQVPEEAIDDLMAYLRETFKERNRKNIVTTKDYIMGIVNDAVIVGWTRSIFYNVNYKPNF